MGKKSGYFLSRFWEEENLANLESKKTPNPNLSKQDKM